MVSSQKTKIQIDEDSALGVDPHGFLARLDQLNARTIHEDPHIRLDAHFLLAQESFNYAAQKFFEVFGVDLNLTDVRSKLPPLDESPRLHAMLRMLELKKEFEYFSELRKELKCLRDLTSRRLPSNRQLRTHFGKIVDYKSIPPFVEYEVMSPSDKASIDATLVSELERLSGIFYRVFLAMFKGKLQSIESAAGFNAAYLAATNPERFAEIQEQLEE